MSDITMCEGKGCPIKEKCKRYTANPNKYRQSYFGKEPFIIDKGKFTCEVFWGEQSDYLFEQLKSIIKEK